MPSSSSAGWTDRVTGECNCVSATVPLSIESAPWPTLAAAATRRITGDSERAV